MAKRLSIDGYGQLELNQVAFRRDGRIEAQCKLASDIEYVENGMLLAVDQATRTVSMPTGDDEFIALNYTTEHMYDERLAFGLKHFKLDNGSFLPRLGYLATGDKFTTNCISIEEAAGDLATKEEVLAVIATAAYGHACDNGSILVNNTKDRAVVKVVKADTMPDGQFAVKFIAL
jgi:hypothetical protein